MGSCLLNLLAATLVSPATWIRFMIVAALSGLFLACGAWFVGRRLDGMAKRRG